MLWRSSMALACMILDCGCLQAALLHELMQTSPFKWMELIAHVFEGFWGRVLPGRVGNMREVQSCGDIDLSAPPLALPATCRLPGDIPRQCYDCGAALHHEQHFLCHCGARFHVDCIAWRVNAVSGLQADSHAGVGSQAVFVCR